MNERIRIRVRPMLATLVSAPFDRPGWVYEEKYDGDRILGYKEGARVRLLSRNAKNRTDRFPNIAAALGRLHASTVLLDGEVVVFDRRQVSRFQLLQQGSGAAVYVVFDCLFLNGRDLREEPLAARRAALETLLSAQGELRLSRRLATNGLRAYELARRAGYEGVVAKDSASRYTGTRSKSWLKVKVHQEDEFIIVGYTAPRGTRRHFGALLLGAYAGGKLRYVGKVGTGFDETTLARLCRQFRPLAQHGPATLVNAPRNRDVTFLRPLLVAQISYQELTADHKLRQAVYLGLRDDKSAQQVRLPVVSA